jgi:putative DNA primase/helicase
LTPAFSEALATLQPQQKGSGWVARCPAHEDNAPSLRIDEFDDGKVGLICHAGCDTRDVVRAMGVTMSDLFEPEATPIGGPVEDAVYDYTDERGQLLYQVVRYKPKAFRQRRPLPGDDRWDWNLEGVDRVPYRLPFILTADEVVVVEGEKDADRLSTLGIEATCNASGASKWRPEWAHYFAGKTVVVIPDNDDPGRKHAQEVRDSLVAVAKRVRIVELPGLPAKGDVSDFLDTHSKDELLALLRPSTAPSLAQYIASATATRPDLYPDIIPAGGLMIFVGQPRSFKTMAALQMMFSVASGYRWLGHEPNEMGDALYVSEEGAPSKVRDRLIAMSGAYKPTSDIRILHRQGVRMLDGDPSWDMVRQSLDEMDNPKVVILDTLAALMVGDENSVMDIREAIRPAQRLITDYGVTVALVHHINKGGEGRMGNRMRGSSALWGACDGTLGFVREEDSNGVALDLGEVRVETKDNEPSRIRFSFNPETMTLKAEERPRCTPEAIVAEVSRRQAESDPVRIEDVRTYFEAGRSWFFEQVKRAEPLGLVSVNKGHYRVSAGMFR